MMATFNSELIQRQESGKNDTNLRQSRGSTDGFLQVVQVPTGAADGDSIKLFNLLPGEVISPESMVAYPNLGTNVTIRVGTAADDDKYRAATTASSAGQQQLSTNVAARTLEDIATTTETPVYLKFAGGNPTAGEKLSFFWKLVHSTRL